MKGYDMTKQVLFRMDPERAHDFALWLLRRLSLSPHACTALTQLYGHHYPRLEVQLFGVNFSSPLGVAAGLDKNGVAVATLQALGFGFVEIGTVTPLPQPGQPCPRMFRLLPDLALINRMGFPSYGMEAVAHNLDRTPDRLGKIGLNIGPNKESVEAGTVDDDCVEVFERLHGYAAYVVINVSSPNTAQLRTLQGRKALHHLLSRVLAARIKLHSDVPILVKIAPDLTDGQLDEVLQVVTDLELSGIVATNTTAARPEQLRSVYKREAGGLSGAPLQHRSLEVVRRIYTETGGLLPIIASGGVFTGSDLLRQVAAGATLVQVYTGIVYQGPGMARDIHRSASQFLDQHQIASLEEVRGTQTQF